MFLKVNHADFGLLRHDSASNISQTLFLIVLARFKHNAALARLETNLENSLVG